MRQFIRLSCDQSLCWTMQHIKYWLFMLQTVFDDHMVVRVPRNSCFVTEAFDTTVTATLTINSSRERHYIISYRLDERIPPICRRSLIFSFSYRLPAILDVKNYGEHGSILFHFFSFSFCFKKPLWIRIQPPCVCLFFCFVC